MLGPSGKAEVQDPDPAVAADDDVVGFEVPVHESDFMGGCEAAAGVDEGVANLLRRLVLAPVVQ